MRFLFDKMTSEGKIYAHNVFYDRCCQNNSVNCGGTNCLQILILTHIYINLIESVESGCPFVLSITYRRRYIYTFKIPLTAYVGLS